MSGSTLSGPANNIKPSLLSWLTLIIMLGVAAAVVWGIWMGLLT
jgi:hypothetical protein